MILKKRTCYVLLVLILFINSVVVYADNSIEQDKKRYEQTKQRIDKVEEELNEKKREYKDVTKQIKKLDLQLDEIDKELQKLEGQLNNLNNDIEVTKKELLEAEKNIEEKNDILNKRLRVMYKNGTVGYLEVLLASKDLEDLLTRLDMIKRIVENDVELLKYMKEQREQIKEKKAQLETQKKMLLSTKQTIQKKRKEIEVVSRAKQQLMRSLASNIKELEKQEDDLLNLAKRLEEEIRRKQIAQKYAGGKLTWPTPGYYRITSPYGMRVHPILKTKKMHTGIDIGVPLGGTIVAANDGVVRYAGWYGGYGKVVIIDHGGGISTLYAHNSRLLVKKGQSVKRGQAVSKAGSTGYSTGPHLHFEVRKNGAYTNPMPWLKK
ncbi:murein hydrolase activator EnvC family protein [Caldisalinibacter kiritimatiensis]|uniref:Membrane protein n=1 Tax=Caldisalinibacter kiritimatiensis TaxID=1304284 RepID=R1ASC6_9FIRM|nr:peptidoglycan DD-metalloendopeptidase family protein [Caldisalinibacter kiritimatiensis]EOC99551.1 Membrane protein [Caldisalinibacter kiritimatiensis]